MGESKAIKPMMKRMLHKRNLYLAGRAAVVIVAVALVWYASRQLSQPVTVTLTSGNPTSLQPAYNIDLTPKVEVGKYASFSYPSGLNARTRSAKPPYLESFYYTARASTVESWVLAINVATLPADDLRNSSNFMLRRNHPEQFSESRENINGATVIIMTDTSTTGFKRVAFLQHEGMLATVSLTTGHAASEQMLQKAFDTVLYSWRWLR